MTADVVLVIVLTVLSAPTVGYVVVMAVKWLLDASEPRPYECRCTCPRCAARIP